MLKKKKTHLILGLMLAVLITLSSATAVRANHDEQWGNMLMHYTPIGFGQTRTASTYYIDNGTRCDPTQLGHEYVFVYRFSSNVTNPAGLATNSPNLAVNLALIRYDTPPPVGTGGVKFWYDTTSPTITTCVGDGTLSAIGDGSVPNGANIWKDAAKVYK